MGSIAMAEAPQSVLPRIWVARAGAELPLWLTPAVTGEVASDGSFNLDTPEGVRRAIMGNIVFEVGGEFYTCRSGDEMRAKVAEIAASVGAPVVRTARAEQAPAPHISEPKKVDLKYKPARGTEPAVQQIRLDKLLIDPSYQRMTDNGPSQKLIKDIAINWDWRLCIPLLVSKREDGLYIIDGQHRRDGAILRGDPDVAHLPCAIFEFDNPAEEAKLFRQANKVRRAVNRIEDFHAAVAAEDEDMVAVKELIEGAGLTAARHQAHQYVKPGQVVFVATIAKALKKHGQQVCHAALSMIAQAFEGQKLVAGTPIFETLCTLLVEFEDAGNPLDQSLMVAVLREIGLEDLNGVVKSAERYERTNSLIDRLRQDYREAEGE